MKPARHPKPTIVEVARAILQIAKRPMHVKAIYKRIIAQSLYSFGAKEPIEVVARKMRGATAPFTPTPVFAKTAPNTFVLLQQVSDELDAEASFQETANSLAHLFGSTDGPKKRPPRRKPLKGSVWERDVHVAA